MRTVPRRLLVLLALLSAAQAAQAETDPPITPERADALFAWFDQLPLPGLHGSEAVRVWTGSYQGNAQGKSEPVQYLGFLVEESPTNFRILAPDSEEQTYTKRGIDPGEPGFIGFRKVALLDEAREFLSQLEASNNPDDVRNRWFSQSFQAFYFLARPEMEDLTLARWAAMLGDNQLARSLLNAPHSPLRGARNRDPLETRLQQAVSPVLRTHAYRAFADKQLVRSDLLSNFQKIVALCPKVDLSNEREAIRILERMIRDDGAHPVLTDPDVAALPPPARAEELVFRLRDENRQQDPALLGAAAPTGNGALQALEDLGLAAAPSLVKALDDDSFTREAPFSRFAATNVSRVRDYALAALKVISGCSFAPSGTVAGYRSNPAFDVARMWWEGVSEKGEKNYLMERIAAGDAHYEEFARQLLKKYPGNAIPLLIERSRSATDLKERVTLLKNLWKQEDPRCIQFFAGQVGEGRELGDRVAAAYGFRYLHDARAVSAMCAEWRKLVAAKDESNWRVIDERNSAFDNPWSVVEFLASSNTPEAILCLGEETTSLPVQWRSKIVSRLTEFSRRGADRTAGFPNQGEKKAIEDVLHGFLTDVASYPANLKDGADLIGAGRVCDLAALELHEIWPQRYEFDRWLSSSARTRQCLLSFNVRARELGEPRSALPPEAPQKPLDLDSAKIVTEVEIAPPLDKSELGAKIAAMRGSPLDGASLATALGTNFSKPEKEMHGFALNIARFRDTSGISIHLLPLADPKIEPNDSCEAVIITKIESQVNSYFTDGAQGGSPYWSSGWPSLAAAVKRVATAPPQAAFTIGLYFGISPRMSQPVIIRPNALAPAPPPK